MSKEITLYTISNCPHCNKTRELLTELVGANGFKWVFTDRLFGDERNEAMRRLRAINPDIAFPVTFIGDESVVGYKEDHIRELLA
ncbi:glutaredoxin family protein [Pseudodesulfovibrio cashew]|uniref:Glutaredoxin family protein n=1 Tax=Pseudodesulfovibrio cashew TaxID=2678688 RepID=A0A6I6JC66_9BACT|nr:glutaredoxin family protein [Pseudodesulfovibrio cashew]QGY40375.1 glutaredoxin family protein [Pseudodesulfovibrio cashew]